MTDSDAGRTGQAQPWEAICPYCKCPNMTSGKVSPEWMKCSRCKHEWSAAALPEGAEPLDAGFVSMGNAIKCGCGSVIVVGDDGHWHCTMEGIPVKGSLAERSPLPSAAPTDDDDEGWYCDDCQNPIGVVSGGPSCFYCGSKKVRYIESVLPSPGAQPDRFKCATCKKIQPVAINGLCGCGGVLYNIEDEPGAQPPSVGCGEWCKELVEEWFGNNGYLSDYRPFPERLPNLVAFALAEAERSPLPNEMLQNLLAVIHRDGGHYVAAHGLEKASAEAEKIVANFNALLSPPDEDYSCGADYCDDPACVTHNKRAVAPAEVKEKNNV